MAQQYNNHYKKPNNHGKSTDNEPKRLPEFTLDIQNKPEILSKTAEKIAQCFGQGRDVDKSTQIRKFYDEVVKLTEQQDFSQVAIHIHMLPAKSAYAQGRKLVSHNFHFFITKAVRQIKNETDLKNFKLLFESVLGFYKKYSKGK